MITRTTPYVARGSSMIEYIIALTVLSSITTIVLPFFLSMNQLISTIEQQDQQIQKIITTLLNYQELSEIQLDRKHISENIVKLDHKYKNNSLFSRLVYHEEKKAAGPENK